MGSPDCSVLLEVLFFWGLLSSSSEDDLPLFVAVGFGFRAGLGPPPPPGQHLIGKDDEGTPGSSVINIQKIRSMKGGSQVCVEFGRGEINALHKLRLRKKICFKMLV